MDGGQELAGKSQRKQVRGRQGDIDSGMAAWTVKTGHVRNTDQRRIKQILLQQRETSNQLKIRKTSHPLFPPKLSAQPQRRNCFSGTLSKYRAPFLGYFSKSCAISARSSVDNSTSPPAWFSKVRFTFLCNAGAWGHNEGGPTRVGKQNSRGPSQRYDVVTERANPGDAHLSGGDALPIRYDS